MAGIRLEKASLCTSGWLKWCHEPGTFYLSLNYVISLNKILFSDEPQLRASDNTSKLKETDLEVEPEHKAPSYQETALHFQQSLLMNH